MVQLVLTLLGCGVAWVIGLLLWPFTACGGCGGSGKNAGSNRGRWGNCRRCGGSGKRLRLGARLVHRIVARKQP
jgi:hypothetical protein